MGGKDGIGLISSIMVDKDVPLGICFLATSEKYVSSFELFKVPKQHGMGRNPHWWLLTLFVKKHCS